MAAPPDPGSERAAPQHLRVTVLAGGPSAERDISLQSGAAIATALRDRGHDVFVSDINPQHLAALDHPADVIFPALHGTFGEDGTLQRIMEERGLRFVGTGARGSAIAMDKVAAKSLVAAAEVPTPRFEVWDSATLNARSRPDLPLPCIVKPIDQGSSVATTIVREVPGFRPAVETTIAMFGRALVEGFVRGEELTVGFVGDEALPPICIRPKRAFYDYAAKYEDDATEYLFDAGYPTALLQTAQALSRRVFARIGCRHLARVDWMVDAEQRLWFLEVNTLPGFTSHSLVPKAAARAGLSFEALVDRLVRMAFKEGA
jgi:D-alanine-D-alanine ligase